MFLFSFGRKFHRNLINNNQNQRSSFDWNRKLANSYLSAFANFINKSTANMTTQSSIPETEGPKIYESGSSSVAFVTTPDETIAKKLAHQIVTGKLAACVNIIPKITSIYVWDGKINEDAEILLMIKTRTSRIDELTKFIRENHPYSVAEVITLPIENGNAPYLEWISKSVSDSDSKK